MRITGITPYSTVSQQAQSNKNNDVSFGITRFQAEQIARYRKSALRLLKRAGKWEQEVIRISKSNFAHITRKWYRMDEARRFARQCRADARDEVETGMRFWLEQADIIKMSY